MDAPQAQPPPGIPPFLWKTYTIVNSNSPGVSWNENGTSFTVWKPEEFASKVLPLYFKHSNFCSFVRQLNIYGFRKLDDKSFEFGHEKFVRGNMALLSEIPRRKSVKREKQQGDAAAEPIEDDGDDQTDLAAHQSHAAPSAPSNMHLHHQSVQSHPPQSHQNHQQHHHPMQQHIVQPSYGPVPNIPSPSRSDPSINLVAEVEKLRRQQEVTVAILQRVVKELDLGKRRYNRLQEQYNGLSRLLSVLIPPGAFNPVDTQVAGHYPTAPQTPSAAAPTQKKDPSSTLGFGMPLPDIGNKYDPAYAYVNQQELPLEGDDQEGIDRLLRDLLLEQHGYNTSPLGSSIPH